MSSVLNNFAAAGNGSPLIVRKGASFDYSLVGTFVGTWVIQSSDDAVNWSVVATGTAAGNAQGSAVVVGAGAKNGANVSVIESGDKGMHISVFTFSNLAVSVVSVTTGNGVGGTKFYDFPEGYIRVLGCTADLSLDTDVDGDFTDATAEGDIGIGTVAPANADALGTDATDDNLATAATITMSAYADASVVLAPEAALNIDGTTTPVDAFVNILIDAADIDDGVTTDLFVSGSVTLVWSMVGDY